MEQGTLETDIHVKAWLHKLSGTVAKQCKYDVMSIGWIQLWMLFLHVIRMFEAHQDFSKNYMYSWMGINATIYFAPCKNERVSRILQLSGSTRWNSLRLLLIHFVQIVFWNRLKYQLNFLKFVSALNSQICTCSSLQHFLLPTRVRGISSEYHEQVEDR